MKLKLYRMITWGKTLESSAKMYLYKVSHIIGNSFPTQVKRVGRAVIDHREMLGYYAVLTLVLVALGAGAHDYRSRRISEHLKANIPATEQGLPVQVQSDPTMEPQAESKAAFVMPLQGPIIGDFSDDELVWSTTLQLWQTHSAVDIAANVGETVVSAADGVVVEAYSDALYGNVIAIDHGNGCMVRYASLNTLQMVKIGQKVEKGEIISSVGTCVAEAELGAHVHIECQIDQERVDFLSFISESEYVNLQD